MNNLKKQKRINTVLALVLAVIMAVNFTAFTAYAQEEQTGEPVVINEAVMGTRDDPSSEPTPDPSTTPDPDDKGENGDKEEEPTPSTTPKATTPAYIAAYQVVNYSGAAVAKVVPGDKVIVAVTVVDPMVDDTAEPFPANGAQTNRIHVNMMQGAFSLTSSSSISVRMRERVYVDGADRICYTIEFRDVTYVGGKPDFAFGVSYTKSNNSPMPGRQYTSLNVNINQATDDIPAPQIILNSANYGKSATVGEVFSLSTVATNTSDMLELDNVSVKIVLPQGLSMASGNSQVLIGKVGKNGTISHTFSLKADGVSVDVTTLPVQLVYTFEAVVNGARTQFTSTQDISINVQQPMRFSIQSIDYDEMMYLGNEGYINVSVVNKGKSGVSNVQVDIESDDFYGWETEFLGNIAAGSSSDASLYFYANETGTATGKVIVTYEDATGNEYSFEEEFTIEVNEPFFYDPGFIEPAPSVVEKKGSALPYIIAVVAVAAAGGGFVFYKKKKAKRLKELEDDDEDI